MGKFTKRTVTEVTFMENISSDDDVRCVTLRLGNEGAGRYFVLSNGMKNSEIFLHDPEDFRVLYETARQLWAQGDVMVPGDAQVSVTPQPDAFEDSIASAFSESIAAKSNPIEGRLEGIE